ncbi:MAG: hypothetical protein HQL69_22515, partial [Magnetococcales bacterium]|nr:hypothetical protein [Magnetococcales bacterium]
MKRLQPASLRHLLMERLCYGLEQPSDPFAKALQQSLEVTFSEGKYILSWSWQGSRFQFTTPDAEFYFHIRGDAKKFLPRRTAGKDYLHDNRERAIKLLDELAAHCQAPPLARKIDQARWRTQPAAPAWGQLTPWLILAAVAGWYWQGFMGFFSMLGLAGGLLMIAEG